MSSKSLQVKKLDQSSDFLGIESPKYNGDCGYDLIVAEDTIIPVGQGVPVSIPTHVALKIPHGFWGFIVTRSSSNKRGLIVLPGIIDEGYTGAIFTLVHNYSGIALTVKRGERLAQFILIPRHVAPLCIVDELPETDRGERGFGSTNIN